MSPPPVRLRVRTRPLADDRDLLDLLGDDPATFAWVRDGAGVVGWGVASRIDVGTGPRRFDEADALFGALRTRAAVDDSVGRAGTGLVVFGSFTFADTAAGSSMVVPRRIVGRDAQGTWLTTIDPPGADTPADPGSRRPPAGGRDRPRYAGTSNPDVHWLEAVATTVRRIEAGEVDKVVLARDHAVWSREPFDPVDVARRLTDRFNACHTFLVDGLVGATPELLAARHGRRVRSRVLAGTAARSSDPATDAALGSALLSSTKDRLEHHLAVDSVRVPLAALSDGLTVDAEPWLLVLDNVQHLATDLTGVLAGNDDVLPSALAIAGRLHPTAAVGGTPRASALRLITELEGMDRGRYAAPVGWMDADGDGEWGIALRCAHVEGARARLFAGVGIVAGSLPESELTETHLKLRAMQDALDDRA